MPVIVGLTGGIGSGKSAAEKQFNTLGVPSVDMDVIARRIVAPKTKTLEQVVQYFKSKIPDILLPDGTLNRSALREHVFSHTEDKCWLEQQLHPAIHAQTLTELKSFQSTYALLVSPLLFEKNIGHDLSIVTDVPETLQLIRASSRDGASQEQIRKIITSQMPRQERVARADFVIDNSGMLEETQMQVSKIHHKLLQRIN